MKFPNHVIKWAHNINSEKKYMIRLKCEITWTGGLPHLPFCFIFYWMGMCMTEFFFTENFNTFGRLFKRNPTYCAGSQTCYFWSSKANWRLRFLLPSIILTGSKGHVLWFVIVGFRSVLFVSVFQGLFLVIVIMIDIREKRNCEGGFWTLEFACLWKEQ